MKINNITKFFSGSTPDEIRIQNNSAVVTRGDIIELFSPTKADDLINGVSPWHSGMQDEDKWRKISFDGGNTFKLRMRIDDRLPNEEVIILKNTWTTGTGKYGTWSDNYYDTLRESYTYSTIVKNSTYTGDDITKLYVLQNNTVPAVYDRTIY